MALYLETVLQRESKIFTVVVMTDKASKKHENLGNVINTGVARNLDWGAK